MKSSKKDKWLDQLISRAAATDKPVPNFEKWLKEHPNAVKSLKTRAEHLQSKSSPRRKIVSREPLFVRFPRLTWACGLVALFLIIISWLACFTLAKETTSLRQELQVARREVAVAQAEKQLKDAQEKQQKAISELHVRVKELEGHVQRGISPRMVWYSESPYYTPERPGEL